MNSPGSRGRDGGEAIAPETISVDFGSTVLQAQVTLESVGLSTAVGIVPENLGYGPRHRFPPPPPLMYAGNPGMTLIEGIGDEVTQFFLMLLLVVMALAAWWSTQISDTPLVRTVLILEPRRRSSRRISHGVSQQLRLAVRNSEDQQQPVNITEPLTEPTTDTGQQQQQTPDEQNAEPMSEEIAVKCEENTAETVAEVHADDEGPECQLRRRRLAFLENMTSPTRTTAITTEPPEPSLTEQEDSEDADLVTGPDSIRIRLKYLNDEQKLVEGRLQEPLGDFRRRHFSLELAANKFVRLIFNGHVLARDAASLEEHGLFDNCVVHCLVHQPRSSSAEQSQQQQQQQQVPQHPGQQTTQQQQQNREWDLGSVAFMFASVMLGLMWYSRCMYSQYFTTTASVALVGITGIFVVVTVGLMLPDQDGLRQ